MTAFLHIEGVYVRKRGKLKAFLHIEPVYVKEVLKIEGIPSHRACLR
jgi:hypothetical protein